MKERSQCNRTIPGQVRKGQLEKKYRKGILWNGKKHGKGTFQELEKNGIG